MPMLFSASLLFAENPVYEFHGKVSDKKTGKSIGDAKIQLERNGEIIVEISTNVDGSFIIKIPQDEMKLEALKIRVKKRGYRTQEMNTIPTLKNSFEIHLERNKAIPIMVPKKSSTGQYIIVQNKILIIGPDIIKAVFV